jgi:predicted transposase YbfD/YdcC
MPGTIVPLVGVFVEIADFRQCRGKRHPLPAILALACAAMLCGARSYRAMADWGRNYGQDLACALGFTHHTTPCAATLHTVFRHLDREQFEARLQRWAESVMAAYPVEAGQDEGIAIDGKPLRGSQKQGAPGTHLVSALGHRLGLTLAQQAVDDKTNEVFAIEDLLDVLVLKGRVVTMDALLTQRYIAQTILDWDANYVMIVKENHPELLADIELLFQELAVVADTVTEAETVDAGHGRIERRHLTASSALADYLPWPGIQQVFRLERTVIVKKTGQRRQEAVYGLTSLSPQRADAQRLLRLTRQHWHIENKSHWVRDVTFDEDHSQVRCGNLPEVMAALRNLAIGLLRLGGEPNIAAACRRYAAQPWAALALMGLQTTTE